VPRRVLIVDDHDSVRESLARLVRAWGHDVAVARDGESALVLAGTFKPEYAVLDLSLPGMSGMDLATRLRATFPAATLRIIALSAYAAGEMRDQCLAAGIDECLTKPREIERLEALLGAD
jgi:CheY-like chemotaxis protein